MLDLLDTLGRFASTRSRDPLGPLEGGLPPASLTGRADSDLLDLDEPRGGGAVNGRGRRWLLVGDTRSTSFSSRNMGLFEIHHDLN